MWIFIFTLCSLCCQWLSLSLYIIARRLLIIDWHWNWVRCLINKNIHRFELRAASPERTVRGPCKEERRRERQKKIQIKWLSKIIKFCCLVIYLRAYGTPRQLAQLATRNQLSNGLVFSELPNQVNSIAQQGTPLWRLVDAQTSLKPETCDLEKRFTLKSIPVRPLQISRGISLRICEERS